MYLFVLAIALLACLSLAFVTIAKFGLDEDRSANTLPLPWFMPALIIPPMPDRAPSIGIPPARTAA